MTLHWTDIALFVAIAVAGGGTIYVLLLRRFERMFAARHRDMERRLAALTEAITMREPLLSEIVPATDVLGTAEIEVAPRPGQEEMPLHSAELLVAAKSESADHEELDLPPEIQVAITAAAMAAFGNHARVRSARRVPSSDMVSPWTQQGRVIVQSSHNLRTRG